MCPSQCPTLAESPLKALAPREGLQKCKEGSSSSSCVSGARAVVSCLHVTQSQRILSFSGGCFLLMDTPQWSGAVGHQARKRDVAIVVVPAYSARPHCGTSLTASEMGCDPHTFLPQFHLLSCSPDLYDLRILTGLFETPPDPPSPPQKIYHWQRKSTDAWSKCCIDHGGCAVCAHCHALVWERHPALQEQGRVMAGETAAVLGMKHEEQRVHQAPGGSHSPLLLCTRPPESQCSLPPEESRGGRGGSEKEGSGESG